MLKKVNMYLAILAVVGAMLCGAAYAYTHITDIQNSHIIQKLEGG